MNDEFLSSLDDEELSKSIKRARERVNYAARNTWKECRENLETLLREKSFRESEKTNYHVNNSRFSFSTDLGHGIAICGNNGWWRVTGPRNQIFVKGGWSDASRAVSQLRAEDKQEEASDEDEA
jgi:hypothetical protein